MQKLGRRLLITIILAVVIYIVLGIYGNSGELRNAFTTFRWKLLPFILLLAFFNYIARFFRWLFYCHQLGFQVETARNIIIFGTGLLMTLTPGKSGELVKSYLLKESYEVPINRSAPMVFAERITDFIAVILLSGMGVLIHGFLKLQLLSYVLYFASAFIALVLTGATLTLISKRIRLAFPIITKVLDWIRHFLATTRFLLKPRSLIVAFSLSVPAWFGEALGFYYTLKGFAAELPLTTSVFIYAFATIVGALTFIPGGLGGTEASMTGLIIYWGISKGKAAASILVIRTCTLWFAALVGIVSFAIYNFLRPKQQLILVGEKLEN